MNALPAEIRAASPEEADAFLGVLCAAFQMDYDAARPLFYQDPFYDISHKRVLVTPEEGIASCLTVIPAIVRIGGAEVPVGGIAGVATHPLYQKRGFATALLTGTVLQLADELQYPLSALFPFSCSYYQRFGWEVASRVARWQATRQSLPAFAEGERVRPRDPHSPSERAALHLLHQTATRRRTGACMRDARRWRVIEDYTPGRETIVYPSPSGKMEGYALFERRSGAAADEPDSRIVVHEMLGETAEARRGLVGFLARQTEAARVEWDASPADLSEFGLLAPSETTEPAVHLSQITIRPGFMLRIIDLRAALSLAHAANYAAPLARAQSFLTIRAADPLRPQNNDPVRLDATGVHSGSAQDGQWIAADIHVLAQLYMGYLAPADAFSLGRLQASSPNAVSLADALFPARDPFIALPDQF